MTVHPGLAQHSHVPSPRTYVEESWSARAVCVTCGLPIDRFVIEDDDRVDRWSPWKVAQP